MRRVFGVSGNIYTGQFHRGELHGQGLLRTPAGEQYEGEFVEGRKEGAMYTHGHVPAHNSPIIQLLLRLTTTTCTCMCLVSLQLRL